MSNPSLNIPRHEVDALVSAVGDAVIDLLPPDWDAAVLDVTTGRGWPVHTISHPRRRDAAWVAPSAALARLTAELLATFARHGRPWDRAKVEVTADADGAWDYTADFGFD